MPDLVLTTNTGHSIEYDPRQDVFFISTAGAISRSDAELVAAFIRQAVRFYAAGNAGNGPGPAGRAGAAADPVGGAEGESGASGNAGGPFPPPPKRPWAPGFR